MPNAPADLRFLIVNPPAAAADAYPIGASTWVLLYKDYPADKQAEVKAMVDFLWWTIHDGQKLAARARLLGHGAEPRDKGRGSAQGDHGRREARARAVAGAVESPPVS